MVGVNVLFQYEGLNHRLTINSKNDNGITFDELKKELRDHPKLKEIDFFDTTKYVFEIFDKGFEEYIKLQWDSIISDFSKLRARIRPKSTLIIKQKEDESRKRPLSMYAELNLEEEHAAKILRGSPPPSLANRISRTATPPPSSSTPSYRRSQPEVSQSFRPEHVPQMYRTENSSKSTPSVNKIPIQHKPAQVKLAPVKPSPAPVNRKPSPSPSPSTNLDVKPKVTNIPGKNLPTTVDQSSHLLAKAVQKYNDEFVNIMMFDEVWETDTVWNFVNREIISKGVNHFKAIRETRNAFKVLVDKYIALLEETHLTEAAANESWPLFTFFNSNLNLKPFCERIDILKNNFKNGNKTGTGIGTGGGDKPSSSQTTSSATTTSNQSSEQSPAPKSQRSQIKAPTEDIILLVSDDKPFPKMGEDEDSDIQEVVPITPHSERQTTPPPQFSTSYSPPPTELEPESPPEPIVFTSEDFNLLMAVEDHNKEFYDDIIPEYSVWKDITDQINLYRPFEPSLIMKFKTRFYQLLREFIKIQNSDKSADEKSRWRLYSLFTNLDIEPFRKNLDQ